MGVRILSTVVTPATSYDLTTLQNVKSDLGLSGSTDDDYLTRAITRASDAIAQFCHRVFPVETVKDQIFFDRDAAPWLVPGGGELQLSRWPLVAVTSVLEDGSALVAGTDFIASAAAGNLIRLSGGNPILWPAKSLEVQYSAGYAPIPSSLEDAASRLVKTQWFARLRDPLLRGETIPGVIQSSWWVGATGGGNLPPDVADLVGNYRMSVIA